MYLIDQYETLVHINKRLKEIYAEKTEILNRPSKDDAQKKEEQPTLPGMYGMI